MSGATYVTNTGVLELNGLNLGAEPVVVSGAGAGNGAIVNSGASQQNALRFITLSGDATFGGTARWDVRANPTAALTGNGRKLTKTNANEVWLVDLGETGLGDIEVRQGLLGLADSTTAGNPASPLSVWPGTTLHLSSSDTFELDKAMRVTNATVRSDAGNNTSVGPALFSGAVSLPVGATLELAGPITGSGSITKSSAGTLILSGSNAYSGTLYVDTASDTANAGNVRISGGAALQNAASPIYIRNMNSGTSTLQLDSGITVAQAIQLSGRNNSAPAIQNVSGSNTLAGGFSLQVGGGNYCAPVGQRHADTGWSDSHQHAGRHPAVDFPGGGLPSNQRGPSERDGGGSVALTKTGTGSLTLKAPTPIPGGTVLSQGIIYVQSSRAFGTGAVTTTPAATRAGSRSGSGVTVTNRHRRHHRQPRRGSRSAHRQWQRRRHVRRPDQLQCVRACRRAYRRAVLGRSAPLHGPDHHAGGHLHGDPHWQRPLLRRRRLSRNPGPRQHHEPRREQRPLRPMRPPRHRRQWQSAVARPISISNGFNQTLAGLKNAVTPANVGVGDQQRRRPPTR